MTLIIPNLKSYIVSVFGDKHILVSLKTFTHTIREIWPRLKAFYEAVLPPVLQNYQPGDWVFII